MPWIAARKIGGWLCGGKLTAGAALGHHTAHIGFALPTLGGNTQFKLNRIKVKAVFGCPNNAVVRNSAADANNHVLACWLKDK